MTRYALTLFAVSAFAQPERFDLIVREDLFAGYLSDDMERFNKGLKVCDDRLAANPKDVAPLAWRGSATTYLAIREYEAGNRAAGDKLWNQAGRMFDQAYALGGPDNVGVLATWGGTLVVFMRRAPADRVPAMLAQALKSYEAIQRVQAPMLEKMGVHHRGEVWGGLADIHQRLGETEKSRAYLRKIVEKMDGTPYAKKAAAWLADPAAIQPRDAMTCLSCHVMK
ncbi:MAG: hypothetical protein ACRD96_19930 [Bryobacteraceae bacterium]